MTEDEITETIENLKRTTIRGLKQKIFDPYYGYNEIRDLAEDISNIPLKSGDLRCSGVGWFKDKVFINFSNNGNRAFSLDANGLQFHECRGGSKHGFIFDMMKDEIYSLQTAETEKCLDDTMNLIKTCKENIEIFDPCIEEIRKKRTFGLQVLLRSRLRDRIIAAYRKRRQIYYLFEDLSRISHKIAVGDNVITYEKIKTYEIFPNCYAEIPPEDIWTVVGINGEYYTLVQGKKKKKVKKVFSPFLIRSEYKEIVDLLKEIKKQYSSK